MSAEGFAAKTIEEEVYKELGRTPCWVPDRGIMTSHQPVVAPVRNPRLRQGQIALQGIYLTRGGRFVAQMKRNTNGRNVYEYLGPFPTCTAAAIASDDRESKEETHMPLAFPAKTIVWIINN